MNFSVSDKEFQPHLRGVTAAPQISYSGLTRDLCTPYSLVNVLLFITSSWFGKGKKKCPSSQQSFQPNPQVTPETRGGHPKSHVEKGKVTQVKDRGICNPALPQTGKGSFLPVGLTWSFLPLIVKLLIAQAASF